MLGANGFFRIKLKSIGEIDRYKARLVAQGYTQAFDIDYFETFSPVVKPPTIRIVLSLVVNYGWLIRQLDVHSAFLHDELKEEVFMKQPVGFEISLYLNHVLRLHKALYDLKQSPRAWFPKLSSCLLSWGFVASKADSFMIFFKASSQIVIFLIYVNDILVTENCLSLIQRFCFRLKCPVFA